MKVQGQRQAALPVAAAGQHKDVPDARPAGKAVYPIGGRGWKGGGRLQAGRTSEVSFSAGSTLICASEHSFFKWKRHPEKRNIRKENSNRMRHVWKTRTRLERVLRDVINYA